MGNKILNNFKILASDALEIFENLLLIFLPFIIVYVIKYSFLGINGTDLLYSSNLNLIIVVLFTNLVVQFNSLKQNNEVEVRFSLYFNPKTTIVFLIISALVLTFSVLHENNIIDSIDKNTIINFNMFLLIIGISVYMSLFSANKKIKASNDSHILNIKMEQPSPIHLSMMIELKLRKIDQEIDYLGLILSAIEVVDFKIVRADPLEKKRLKAQNDILLRRFEQTKESINALILSFEENRKFLENANSMPTTTEKKIDILNIKLKKDKKTL